MFHSSEKLKLSDEIKMLISSFRLDNGWSLDDLANYLEINTLTVRNSLSRGYWSDLAITILRLKKIIPDDLAQEYKKTLEREKIERRKIQNQNKEETKKEKTKEKVEQL